MRNLENPRRYQEQLHQEQPDWWMARARPSPCLSSVTTKRNPQETVTKHPPFFFFFPPRKKPPKHPMPEPVACSDVSHPSTEYSDTHPCTNPAKDFFLSSTGSSGWFNKHFMTFIYFLTTQPAQSSTSPCSHACSSLALKLCRSSP